jgi:transcriptional regulator with XRE-family HTH domain
LEFFSMPDEMEFFAPRLRELRQAAKLTQPELAEKIGKTVRSISRLETGEQEATWPIVVSLSKALGVDCRAFLEKPADASPVPRGRPKSADTVIDESTAEEPAEPVKAKPAKRKKGK